MGGREGRNRESSPGPRGHPSETSLSSSSLFYFLVAFISSFSLECTPLACLRAGGGFSNPRRQRRRPSSSCGVAASGQTGRQTSSPDEPPQNPSPMDFSYTWRMFGSCTLCKIIFILTGVRLWVVGGRQTLENPKLINESKFNIQKKYILNSFLFITRGSTF